MYNMYLHEKRAQEEELRSSVELARENRAKSQRQRNNGMAQKYKQRVGTFIRQMITEKPKIVSDEYKGDAGKEGMRNISPRGFRFTMTKEERHQDAIKRHEIFESSPTRRAITRETVEATMNLRPRQEEKELSRTFRFKPTIQAERIADTISLNTGAKFQKSFMPPNEKLIINNRNSIDHKSNNRGSIMTTQMSHKVDSKARGGSTYRGSLADNPSKGFGGGRIRHASVQPFNKSIYSRGRNGLDHSKTFFKGASEYMQVQECTSLRNSLAEDDGIIKKILDDSKVVKNYKDQVQKSKEEDIMNGAFTSKSHQKVRKIINVSSGGNFMRNSHGNRPQNSNPNTVALLEHTNKQNFNFPHFKTMEPVTPHRSITGQQSPNQSMGKSPFTKGQNDQAKNESGPKVDFSNGVVGSQESVTQVSDMQKQLEELLNPKSPSMNTQDVTRQMLLQCKVLRKRNTNVSPLTTASRLTQTSKKSPINGTAGQFVPSQQSLNEYLDGLNYDNNLKTMKSQTNTRELAANQDNILRTAATTTRPTYTIDVHRASTVENPQGRMNLTERKIPMMQPIKKLIKPRTIGQSSFIVSLTDRTQTNSRVSLNEIDESRQFTMNGVASTNATQAFTGYNRKQQALPSSSHMFSKK